MKISIILLVIVLIGCQCEVHRTSVRERALARGYKRGHKSHRDCNPSKGSCPNTHDIVEFVWEFVMEEFEFLANQSGEMVKGTAFKVIDQNRICQNIDRQTFTEYLNDVSYVTLNIKGVTGFVDKSLARIDEYKIKNFPPRKSDYEKLAKGVARVVKEEVSKAIVVAIQKSGDNVVAALKHSGCSNFDANSIKQPIADMLVRPFEMLKGVGVDYFVRAYIEYYENYFE